MVAASASSSSGSGDFTDAVSYWWFHALDSTLYFLLAVAAAHRSYQRWKWGQRHTVQRSHATFAALGAYGISRSITEAFTASGTFAAGFGTFAFGAVASVPGAFFALSQAAMIARWVRTAEAISFTMRHTRLKLGRVALLSSCGLLVLFCVLLLVAVVDAHMSFSPLSKDDWLEVLNLLEGILYVYNGGCFIVLGVQLGFVWTSLSHASTSPSIRWRIMAIACIFSSLSIARGVLLCVGGAAQQSEDLHVMLTYAVGPPAVLLVEWLALVLCFFTLQPSRPPSSSSDTDGYHFSGMIGSDSAPLSVGGTSDLKSSPETPRARAWQSASSESGTAVLDSPASRYAAYFGRSSSPQRKREEYSVTQPSADA
jgi:hypothetical protein